MISKVNIKKLQWYVGIGMLAFLIEYGSFTALIFFGSNLIISQSASFGLGLAVSFLGSRLVTFRAGRGKIHKLNVQSQIVSFAVLAALNLVVTNFLLHYMVSELTIPALIAKVVVMGCVVCWNYLVFNLLIFKTSS